MLTSEQISAYFENGYLLVEDVVTPEQLQRMQDITHEFIDRSR
ncbi:MAG: phytanoyl-CoA dioxygenase family protein, partial [Tateyamaria sp.]|nr:phytanoyl-CoA dioxygenase family protein [Tateyamaria sp.]